MAATEGILSCASIAPRLEKVVDEADSEVSDGSIVNRNDEISRTTGRFGGHVADHQDSIPRVSRQSVGVHHYTLL